MKIARKLRYLIYPVALASLGYAAIVPAQTDEDANSDVTAADAVAIEEQVGPPPPAAEDGEIENLVFDESTQSYRLIEDDEEDDWIEGPSEREAQEEELKRLFELYREALSNKDFLEADTLAKRVVELSIRLNGLDSHDSAKAITNLGIAQHNNKDFDSALRNFMSSIDIVERIDDNLSPALINPLQGLAASQAAIGRVDLARLSYQRAVHVSHVNDGPHNPGQIDILESMAELHISQGSYDDASDIQQHIYAIQARKIDPLSLDIIPALQKKAHWQHRLQAYHRERVTWRQIINVVERHYGKQSLELIAPLTNLGKSYLFVSPAEFEYQPEVSTSSGESYLRRANKIAKAHPDATWTTVEGTLLSLGDYYVLSGRPNRASRIYLETWEYLSDGLDQDRLKHRRDNLGKVKTLQQVFPPKYYNGKREDEGQPPPDSMTAGTMAFGYIVSATGRVTNLHLIEVRPREFEAFATVVGRTLRRQIYRPRIDEGTMVATPEVIYEHEFFYRPSEMPALPSKAGTDEEASAETEESG